MNGEYPKSWGNGIIFPIFKGDETSNPENYRGITLINSISKIYSQLLLNRLTKWTEKQSKIIENQFGFQKGKSTTDCIFILHAIIAKTLSVNKKLYCAFIDFEKCFDEIDRSYLFQKLLKENVSSKHVNAMRNMYTTIKSCVRINNELSPFIKSNIGVKQGDPSSSLLFLFFVNDILLNMKSDIDDLFTIDDLKVFLLSFADDAALFAHSPQALQSLLNDLHMYCTTWNLIVNSNKTKIMIFERGRHSTFDFVYNDTVLDIVDNFKYLGIYFFKNGSWSRTQKYIAKHSQSALHNLFIVFNQLSLNIDDKCNLFDSLVGSVLNYSASIWGNHPCKNIELIHCKFMRKILGVKKSTNLDGLYGELGRYPMEINRKLLIMKFWIKSWKNQKAQW